VARFFFAWKATAGGRSVRTRSESRRFAKSKTEVNRPERRPLGRLKGVQALSIWRGIAVLASLASTVVHASLAAPALPSPNLGAHTSKMSLQYYLTLQILVGTAQIIQSIPFPKAEPFKRLMSWVREELRHKGSVLF
jgi:hypothetical protein